MKKTAMMIVAMALVMAIPIITLAQDNNQPTPNDTSTTAETSFWKNNFSVTASLKIWRATNSFKTVGGDDVDTTSNMYGPSVNVAMFDKWYTGLSYYWGDGFDYTIESTNESTGQDFEVDVDGKKTDLDIWVGYRFHPRASAFLGYKSSRFKQDGKTELNDITAEFSAEINYYGPVVGVNGNYPIKDSGFILFGTFGYAFLDGESKVELKASNTITGESEKASGDETDKYRGPAIEFGVSYIFRNIPKLSLTGGYKYQSYENVDNSDVDPWTFSGLTLGANYRL